MSIEVSFATLFQRSRYARETDSRDVSPMSNRREVFAVAVVAFAAFRFFDILKPPPVRQLEKLPAGWGILADDLGAGVYANIVSQLVLRLWLPR